MNTPVFEKHALKDIIAAGEDEWLKNAPWTYGGDAINVWEEDVLPRLLSANLQEIDVEDLRLYCATLVSQLREAFWHDRLEDINQALKTLTGQDGS